MKQPLLIALACLLAFASCKKNIEKQEENVIVQAMTDGRWVITHFTTQSTDITADFNAYQFQYYSNNTVDAIMNGIVAKTGSWEGDVNSLSISADFSTAGYPLQLLNGTWHVTDNSWTFVEATMTIGTETRTLRLEKQ